MYHNIPHDAGRRALRQVLDRRNNKRISTNDLVQITEFVPENNYFEFNGKVKHQMFGTAIGTKFAPIHMLAFLWMKQKQSFLKAKNLNHWYSFGISMTCSLFAHMGKKNLRSLLTTLTNINLILNLFMGFLKETFLFWILRLPS